jgi:hypothetical protein
MEASELLGSALFAERSAELSYRAKIASLGPTAVGFLGHRETIELLTTAFGESFVLSEGCSCTTFYQEGDHLGPHRDRPEEECLVTIIVYLDASSPAPESPSTGLVLQVYGQEMTGSSEPRLRIPTSAGAVVIGRGSRFWHERPRLQTGERVVALTGCYKAFSPGAP